MGVCYDFCMGMGDTRQVTLRLSRAGHRRLDEALELNRRLYNAALEERFAAGKYAALRFAAINGGASEEFVERRFPVPAAVTLASQAREVTGIREDDPAYEAQDRRMHAGTSAGTLNRANEAYKRFRQRKQDGMRGGRPRFKSRNRFRTLDIYTGDGNNLKLNEKGGGAIKIKGLPPLHFRPPSRPLPDGQPKVIRITRTPVRVMASMAYEHQPAEPRQLEMMPCEPKSPVGLDVGVANTIATSDGLVEIPAPPRTDDGTQARKRRLSRRMARQMKSAVSNGRAHYRPTGSGKAKLVWSEGAGRNYAKTRAEYGRVCERERLSQRNWIHRITNEIVNSGHDFIAVEDLDIPNMIRSARGTEEAPGKNVSAKRRLNRSILERGWGATLTQLEYKAERAGIRFVRVDPRHTSQACNRCGSVSPDNRKKQAEFRCVECGHRDHADVNAARNILRRGLLALGPAETTPAGAAKQTSAPVRAGAPRTPRSKGGRSRSREKGETARGNPCAGVEFSVLSGRAGE